MLRPATAGGHPPDKESEESLRPSSFSLFLLGLRQLAVALLQENKKKFALDHMRIIAGTAPEAMEELPAPTHAFIGGSSGNMKEIVELLLEKNPQVRMVINCITLETVGETLSCIKEMQTERSEWKWEREVVQLGVSRSKEIGRYHMMMGQNPVYIISAGGRKFGQV